MHNNPFQDISALEHVDFVMKGGVVYKLNGTSVPLPAVRAALDR